MPSSEIRATRRAGARRHGRGAGARRLLALLARRLARPGGPQGRSRHRQRYGDEQGRRRDRWPGSRSPSWRRMGPRPPPTTDKRGRFSIKVPGGRLCHRPGSARATRASRPGCPSSTVRAGGLGRASRRRGRPAQRGGAGVQRRRRGLRGRRQGGGQGELPGRRRSRPHVARAPRGAGRYLPGRRPGPRPRRAAETFLAARPDDRQVQLIAYEAYRELDDRRQGRDARRPGSRPRAGRHAGGARVQRRGDRRPQGDTAMSAQGEIRGGSRAGRRPGRGPLRPGDARVPGRALRRGLTALAGGLALEPASVPGPPARLRHPRCSRTTRRRPPRRWTPTPRSTPPAPPRSSSSGRRRTFATATVAAARAGLSQGPRGRAGPRRRPSPPRPRLPDQRHRGGEEAPAAIPRAGARGSRGGDGAGDPRQPGVSRDGEQPPRPPAVDARTADCRRSTALVGSCSRRP